MTKKAINQPTIKCPGYVHSLPKELADILSQKQKERFSKFAAFCYLMEKQAIQITLNPDKCTTPFIVTITELSLAWGWHRHTVSDFLEDLSSIKVLSVEKTSLGFKIQFEKFDLVEEKTSY